MVCAPCLAPVAVAGGTGLAAYYRKNSNMVYMGAILIIVGFMLYNKPKKACTDCEKNV